MATKDFESKTELLKLEDGPEVISLRKCQLIVTDGATRGKKITLSKDKMSIGKREDNDLVVADKTVSRKHFEIDYVDDAFLLRDLGSTNGTYLNSSRVKEVYLSPGDLIKIGGTTLEFVAFDEKVKIDPSDREAFGELVGRSRKMRQIFSILEKISPSQATVIIEGETGTGKDLVAKAIHEHSGKKSSPFIVFDCSAVAANLIESELFGHEKGSFTGAHKSRRGAFEAASGGIIFLDEIGELASDLQPKLLRALEQREIRRVGSNVPVKIDVRVICATNRNLRKEVQAGNFREDLYYRLSVVKILIPSLRERPEDIPLIVEHFLKERPFNKNTDGTLRVTKVEDEALKMFSRYEWPGNVRELHNVVERAVSFADGNTLTRKNLEYIFAELEHGEERTERMTIDSDIPFKDAKQHVVENFEREYLTELLKQHNYNLSKASREAQIDRKHLRNLVKKYDIPTKE
ncbi:MAG: Fis family transcriptional regulator [Deltaproteobacteria bacterium CG_4_10_14_0_2_um_filter_43_8]|nr:MAG: Fis family transcriptional regulator [Deltaproteobacteria bacterium CG11_big_fil_rev_8_21_14_0_20_42_23]PJA20255.1 MAG: Fis family transcriptional regulator [Deltaproteobacteria bacterium CG_4_10_14_0_2_um_filter_43_8]PJC64037.1 MAG: Fis family transcriptional regulator [Deltaproteobacteria bacterium CG_4_9_14_0_2_um_filter_42_21]